MASDNLAGRSNTELWVDLLTAWFQPRTWRSALYLLLGFPLGIAYFTFLVTGFTVGAGLIIIYAGIPVLAFTFMGAYFFCRLETGLAIELRGAGIIQAPAPWTGDGRIWARVKRTVADEGTWKGIFFLFAMFPIGIATFTIVVTMASVALGFATVLIWGAWSDWYVDWEFQAIVEGFFFALGILMLLAAPHLINLMANGQSRFARRMLTDPEAVDGVPRRASGVAATPEERRERAARTRALAVKSIYIHASLYAAVNALTLIVDLLTPGGPWFYWSLIGWGAGLVLHGAAVYLPFLGGEWDNRKA